MSQIAETLITCHANADFDAFAAMLAARHLYGDAILFFPGTLERGLQQIIAEVKSNSFYHLIEHDPNLEIVKRLIVVDTRQKDRLNHVQALFDKDIEIIVWDHHPETADDLKATELHIDNIGSTTALIVETLKAEAIALEPMDATLLGLGIYGDTGSFTYSSTTERDFAAAGWLVRQGMDVNRISELASHALTSLHIHALNALLESAETVDVNGEAVVVANTSLEHYLGDFAYLVHQMMEMENLTVLIAIGRMADKIHVVARSRVPAIDVARICAIFGGGGHSYAASASVKGMTLNEVKEMILTNLRVSSKENQIARDYMSTPAVGIECNRKIADADVLMLHFGLKAVPVFAQASRKCVGILDAQTASRAFAHGLGEMLVEDYMSRDIHTLSVEDKLSDVANLIVDARQRLVPIVDKEEVVGVITRTDLITLFASEPQTLLTNKPKVQNLLRLMRERLPEEIMHTLEIAGELGQEMAISVYVVGGFVRDLLLNRKNYDIDLVVEGDGLKFARKLATFLQGRCYEHPKFLTALVIYYTNTGEERRLDIATARLEYYEQPAAMPTVSVSSIKMDLFRRDFTMNALAVRLDGRLFGQLVDFFGGQRDLRDGVIRILHTLSFVEDPTRCLRITKFAVRYNFKISAVAEKLIRNAVKLNLFGKLNAARICHEFMAICEEENPVDCLIMLDHFGILNAINEKLNLNPDRRKFLNKLAEIVKWYKMLYFDEDVQYWLIYFLGICHGFKFLEASLCYQDLGLPEVKKQDILKARESMRMAEGSIRKWFKEQEVGKEKISQLDSKLQEVRIECLLFLMSHIPDSQQGLRKYLSRYITQWRFEKADITGRDLMDLGLNPGPVFGKILKEIRYAKLDGEVGGVQEQRNMAMKLASEYCKPHG